MDLSLPLWSCNDRPWFCSWLNTGLTQLIRECGCFLSSRNLCKTGIIFFKCLLDFTRKSLSMDDIGKLFTENSVWGWAGLDTGNTTSQGWDGRSRVWCQPDLHHETLDPKKKKRKGRRPNNNKNQLSTLGEMEHLYLGCWYFTCADSTLFFRFIDDSPRTQEAEADQWILSLGQHDLQNEFQENRVTQSLSH